MSKISRSMAKEEPKILYCCGALNWDVFFEIESLEELKGLPYVDFEVSPGGEVVVSRDKALMILDELHRLGRQVFACGGGSAANTIYALAKLGLKTGFVGTCGADEFGKKVFKELSQVGIDLNLVETGGNTSLALIILDGNRDRFILVSPGSAEQCFAREDFLYKAVGRLFSENTHLHLSSLASPEGQAFQRFLLERLSDKVRRTRAKGPSLSMDPGQVYTNKGKGFLWPYLKSINFLFMTEDELKGCGLSVEEVLSQSVSILFLKRGKEGARVFGKDIYLEEKAIAPHKIIDNTGAGDYFNAGVLLGLIQGDDLKTALRWGILLASLSLRGYGRASLPDKEEFLASAKGYKKALRT